MTIGKSRPTIGLVGLLALTAACEPASLVDARDQIARGGERTIVYALPLIDTVFKIQTLLEDSDIDTTAAGLLAVVVDPESLSVAVGEELEFDDVSFDQFVFEFDQMLETSEATTSVAVPAPGMGGPTRAPAAGPGQISFETPNGSGVVAATIDTGTVVRAMTNGTNCDATVTVSLTDELGATVVSFPTTAVPAGTSQMDSVSVANVSVSGDLDLNTNATFGACVPTIGSSVATDVTFRPMTLESVDLENVNETFTEVYNLLDNEPGLSAVDTVVAASGSMTVNVQNRLPISLTVDLTLNGMLDAGGQPLSDNLVVPAALGDGTYASGAIVFPLAGVTIIPEDAVATAAGSAVASTATISGTVSADAVIVDGNSSFTVASVSGELDPSETTELNVSIEEVEEIQKGDIDLGDLEDPVEESILNDATIALSIGNSADVQVELSDFNLGVVKLDGFGNVPRDAFGDPVYEEDGAGDPILVAITDPGETTLTLTASGTTNLDLDAAPLVDRLVHLLLDDERAAVVAVGDVAVGDGTQARVTSTDSVSVVMGITIGMDFTIPAGGVLFTRTTVGDGLEFDDAEADQLVERLDSATVITEAVNGTPFGVELDIAFVGDSVGDDVDVFSLPGAVLLNTIFLSEPTVDAQGNVTTPSTSTVSIQLTGTEARQLLGLKYSASVRTRLLPGTGGGGRGAMRATDEISLQSQARVVLRSGGVQ